MTPDDAIAVRTVDVDSPVPSLTGLEGYARVRIFVRLRGQPIGAVTLDPHGDVVSRARLLDAIASVLPRRLLTPMLPRTLERAIDPVSLAPTVPVSLVIATRDRPDDLRRCLASLVGQASRRHVEIIVVDNHPASGLTPPIVGKFPGVRLLKEERQGLSYARNAGILASAGQIVVSTDDDIVAPPEWLERLIAPFRDADVTATTGNVLPLELDSRAQQLFETYGGLGRGFQQLRVDGAWFRGLRDAVPTWRLGGTANAAFRASIFREPQIGLLDEALGAGTPTGCSEDTYLFYRILRAGHAIVYEPAAYVWHRHRREMTSFRRQIYDYSKGHVAYHITTLLRDRDPRALIRLGFRLPQSYIARLRARPVDSTPYPALLLAVEVLGNLMGPWSLVAARLRAHRLGPSRPGQEHGGSEA